MKRGSLKGRSHIRTVSKRNMQVVLPRESSHPHPLRFLAIVSGDTGCWNMHGRLGSDGGQPFGGLVGLSTLKVA